MNIKNIIYTTLLLVSIKTSAQDCIMPISVKLDPDFTNVPEAASNVLYQYLNRIATENGLTTNSSNTPFVLTAHCNIIEKNNLPGPPLQTVYNIGLTLYIADTYTQKKFGTSYITLNGIGTSEIKSYIDAFKRINSSKSEIKDLINHGKANMMQYYDTQYQNIIKEAHRLESQQKYEDALAIVLSIPTCSKGGQEASEYGLQIYTRYLDRINFFVLNKAKALWTANQNQESAHKICFLLSQIDPEASCYTDAIKMMKDVKDQIKNDIDFEMRQKYNDKIKLENERIASARAIGVAFGNGQKPVTTNLMWLK